MLDYLADLELGVIDENDDNSDELHTRLNDNLRLTLNSINIIIGRTGSGKTRTVIKEILKLKYLPSRYHYPIYITDEEDDKTFLKYQ
jgi:ABC-type proline/glycine betaine transport system ATPase subunit